MPGVRGRSGGARKDAGSPRQNLRLSRKDARTLQLILRDRKMANPAVTEEEIVGELLQERWLKLDAQYQKDAEIAG